MGGMPICSELSILSVIFINKCRSYFRIICRTSSPQVRAGKVSPVDGMLAEMRKILAEKQGR